MAIAIGDDINIKIKYLQDCQEHIPALAKLWYEEISRHWVQGSSIKSRAKELSKHAQKEKMPFTLSIQKIIHLNKSMYRLLIISTLIAKVGDHY